MTEKKIVVIGAGVSGLLCGKRLSEAGHSVLLIDKELSLIHISEPTRPY